MGHDANRAELDEADLRRVVERHLEIDKIRHRDLNAMHHENQQVMDERDEALAIVEELEERIDGLVEELGEAVDLGVILIAKLDEEESGEEVEGDRDS